MAQPVEIDVDRIARDVLKQHTTTVTVHVKPLRWHTRFRLWLCTCVIALAAWVIGSEFEVEQPDDVEEQRLRELDRIIEDNQVRESGGYGFYMITVSILRLAIDVMREARGLEPYYHSSGDDVLTSWQTWLSFISVDSDSTDDDGAVVMVDNSGPFEHRRYWRRGNCGG